MFQPEAKYEFVRRYCPPSEGWAVFVDIDASEEGRTGGERTTAEAKERQQQMQRDAAAVLEKLKAAGVTVGGAREAWFAKHELPMVRGDRDIVAFHPEDRRCVVAEVEAISSGQAEQKVYKTVGQIVSAASAAAQEGWTTQFVLVVHGEKMAEHLRRMGALVKLGISGLALVRRKEEDEWLFGRALDGVDKMDARGAKWIPWSPNRSSRSTAATGS